MPAFTRTNGSHGPVAVSYTYDANGNRETRVAQASSLPPETTTYAWDNENRLIEVDKAGAVHRYEYDYRTRRISREEPPAGGGAAVKTAVVFAVGLSVAEYVGNAATPTVEYVRGPDLGGGVGGMLYTLRPEGGTLAAKYSYANGRGDVVAQANQGGTVTWTASYEAFGTRKQETGTNVDRQRANTKEEDPTGLLNEGFRYRDLETGTWLSRDPAGFVDGPNLYAYVQQNPWTKFDPDGLFWSAIITAGFAAYDTYQYATGQTSGAEYAQAMALNGAALVADIATAGQGGGLAVRAANATVRVAKAVDRASNAYDTGVAVVENGGNLVSAIGDGDGRGALRAAANLAIDAGGGKKSKADGGFRGGPHSQTSKPRNDGKDSHHMPAKDVSGLGEQNGPAIQMHPHDHKKTSSHGSNPGNTEYRELIGDMIDRGDMRGAMATEIRDVRRASLEGSGDRTKYNGAMREMMDYAKKEGHVPDNSKRKK